MRDRKLVGREAEDHAADHLLSLGYSLITRRFKCRTCELDIVCLDGETLVFVEVRARYSRGFTPEESIGSSKLRSFKRAAEEYMRATGEQRNFRFDIVAIDGAGLRHHINIFADS